jgi:hypothetical protein
MAPATSAGATREARQGRPARWTRDDIIEAIAEWAKLYGEPPRAADWNPSAARWSAATWRIERYREGRPDGTPWPSLNRAKALFGGSLNAALEAAGFEPNKPGPKRRRDVTPELLERTEIAPAARAVLDAARAEAREERLRREASDRARAKAGERAEALAAELREAKARLSDAKARRPAAVANTKTTKAVRAGVGDAAATRRARAAAGNSRAATKADVAKARLEAAEARRAASRAAAKLERAEATISTLREERRELRAEAAGAARKGARDEQRLAALETRLAAALKRADELAARETVVHLPAPEAAVVDRARDEADDALRAATEAEERAARAERRYAELAHAVTGERRRLTRAEMDELRTAGPAGPSVVAEAIGELARARKDNNPHRVGAALTELAAAAVSWRERL